jgi:signal transduction histidine kinase
MMAQGLEVLQRNTNTLIGLISNLLDTSRIVAGTLTMEFKEVDLKQAVRASVETLRVQAAEKGIAVATLVEIPEAVSCTVLGDEARLHASSASCHELTTAASALLRSRNIRVKILDF